MRFPNLDYPKAEDVLTPDDHGRFYYSRENASKIQWIWEGNSRINQFIDPIIKDDYTRLCEEYLKPIVVDLSKPKCDIKVVRIISTALVPINFGFYSAHYTHPSIISAGGAKPHSLELPHYFA